VTDRHLKAGAIGIAVVLVGALALTGWAVAKWHPKVNVPMVVQVAPTAARVPVVTRRSPGRPTVSGAWVEDTAAKAGIPAPAMRAYGEATLLLSKEDPGCHLGWTTLAGVGYVESLHGTIGGRTLRADGLSSTPIIGPALNGKGKFAAISATPAGTRLHGDPTWDHAVGPLQFIESTWQRWAADGDGDGKKDPFDIDDAAYATAHYLCADGHDLATAAGWNGGIFSYNHSADYIRSVYAAAEAYATRTAG
jgi:membrane-bound lytic murein transglycosylase B